jgi:hypothetical protein
MSIKENIKNLQFNQKFIGEDIINNEINDARSKIKYILENSNGVSDCYLSFYAVAKNIRFVSSYFFQNIKHGKKSIISNNCRPGEDFFWSNITKSSWYPWLWGRYLNKPTNESSWNTLFNNIDRDFYSISSENKSVDDFYLYLACLDHTFSINENQKNYLSSLYGEIELPNKPIIGLQIRRGEIVKSNGDVNESWNANAGVSNGARPIYQIDDYMVGVQKIAEYLNTNYVFVSTDSLETIQYLVENYKDYVFLHHNYDRTKFVRYNGNPAEVALEFDIVKNESLTQHYTESCIMDLDMLSKCDGYVGGMKHSEYGLCGWLLQMVKKEKVTPYYNVEGDFNLSGGDLNLLLL